jgi:HK97 family phage major capsid protein
VQPSALARDEGDDVDLKNAVEDVKKAVADFRAENERALKETKEHGRVSAETAEKVDRLNARVSEVQAQLDEVQKQAQRKSTAGAQDADPKKAEHRKAFTAFMRGVKNHGLDSIQAAVSVGSDPAGGYAVPETLDLEIERYERDNAPMRSVCNVMTLSNENYQKLVSQGGAGSGWVGEQEARTETTTPTLAALSPYFGELYAEPKTTQRALDDMAINPEAWLSEEVGIEFAEQENDAFTRGNGVKKPKGILGYTLSTDVDGTRAFGSIQKIVSGSAGNFVADKLLDLVHALKRGYRTNAQFMLSNLSHAAVRKLKDGQGNYLWHPDFASGGSGTLLGYPIIENDDMPDPAADANALLFGDFRRAYCICDIRGVRVLRDDLTSRPYVKFYTTKRLGGMLVQDRAVKVLTLSA